MFWEASEWWSHLEHLKVDGRIGSWVLARDLDGALREAVLQEGEGGNVSSLRGERSSSIIAKVLQERSDQTRQTSSFELPEEKAYPVPRSHTTVKISVCGRFSSAKKALVFSSSCLYSGKFSKSSKRMKRMGPLATAAMGPCMYIVRTARAGRTKRASQHLSISTTSGFSLVRAQQDSPYDLSGTASAPLGVSPGRCGGHQR